MRDDSAWHLDKKLPLGLVIGLATNIIFGIWYASKLDSRVGLLEQHEIGIIADTAKLKDIQDNSREKLIRMETELQNILETLKDMKDHMSMSRRRLY